MKKKLPPKDPNVAASRVLQLIIKKHDPKAATTNKKKIEPSAKKENR